MQIRESAPGVRDTQFRSGESQNCKRRRMIFRYNLRRARQGRRRKMANAFMQEAIERAVENVRSGRGGPFAAVVVKEGRIIAAGANCVTKTIESGTERANARTLARGLHGWKKKKLGIPSSGKKGGTK